MPSRTIDERLQAGEILLMDGGMGSELERRGVDVWQGYEGVLTSDRTSTEHRKYLAESDPADMRRVHEALLRKLGPWSASANMTAPDVIRAIHEDYLRVGCDIILTNNFFSSRSKLARLGPEAAERWEEHARASVREAVAARDAINPEAYVLGAIAPPADADIRSEFPELAAAIADEGADVILCEYLGAIDECVASVESCASVGVPLMIGLRHVTAEGTLQYLETFEDLAGALEGANLSAVLLMCSPAEDISAAMPKLRETFDQPIGAYSRMPRVQAVPPEDLEEFTDAAKSWLESGAQIIGGCCGTQPDHIAAIAPLAGREPVLT